MPRLPHRSLWLALIISGCLLPGSPPADAQGVDPPVMGAARMGEVLRGVYPRILRYFVPRGGFSVSRQILVRREADRLIASIPHLFIRDPDPDLARRRPVLSLAPFEAVAATDGDAVVLTYQGPLEAHLLARLREEEVSHEIGVGIDIGSSRGTHRFGHREAETLSLDLALFDLDVVVERTEIASRANIRRIDIVSDHHEVAPGVIDGSAEIELSGIRVGPQHLLDGLRQRAYQSAAFDRELPLKIDRIVFRSHSDGQHDDLLRAFPPFRVTATVGDAADQGDAADVARLLFGDPPLVRDATSITRVEGVTSTAGLALDTAEFGLTITDGGTDAVDVEMGFSLAGLRLPIDGDDARRALVPTTVSLSQGIADIPGRSMAVLAERLDAGEPLDAALLTAAFDGAETMIYIDAFEITAEAYTITGFGQLIADSRAPSGFSGQAVFAISGLDTVIQLVAGDPEQAGLIGLLTLMQALGTRDGSAGSGTPLWSYSFVFQPDGSVTLNGSDITALVGSMVPARWGSGGGGHKARPPTAAEAVH